MAIRKLSLPTGVEVAELFGEYDRKAKYIQKKLDVRISIIGDEIWIKGEDGTGIDIAGKIVDELVQISRDGHLVEWREFEYIVDQHLQYDEDGGSFKGVYNEVKETTLLSNRIRPKTIGQKNYMETMKEKELVFSIGPAGTGKTYLAVAMAVDFLKSGKVQRIILTRPAVEAGEKLGYLPGTLLDKVDPYLRPLYDALMEMIPAEKLAYFRESSIIEVVPLAYMRGRTLNNSFIILDEAQNTTYQQMKMFLTRIGFGSRVVVTGDITQIDLPRDSGSGLVVIQKVLGDIQTIGFSYLTDQDVVRNPLVKDIIKAYDEYEREEKDEE